MKRPAFLSRFACCLISALLPTLPLAAQAGDAASRAQADAFLAKAGAALSAGNSEAARVLTASAVELAPGDSEALFMRAEIELADRSRTAEGVSDLRAALQAATWRRTAPWSAELALAGVLLRTGKLTDARALLEPLARSHPEDYRPLLLLARAEYAFGDGAGTDRSLVDAALRFPLVDEFRLLSADRLDGRGRRQAALDAVATGVKVHPDSLPLLLAFARLETPGRRSAAVELYLLKGGRDPMAPLLGLESSLKDRARYLGLFLADAGLSRQDLVDRAAAAVRSSRDLSRTLQDAMNAYTGNRDLDRNADGFWEDRWVFDKGSVARWAQEPAQDGVAAFAADFSGGVPVTLTWASGPGQTVTARYSQYPFLDSATDEQGRKWLLAPHSIRFDFLRAAPASAPRGLAPRVAVRPVPPLMADLRKAAYRWEEYGPDGARVARSAMLSRGVPLYIEEELDGDGLVDHRLWYSNGAPSRGERMLPGGPLIRETWQNGRIVSGESDTDGDGKIDYRESYGVNPLKSWDYNEDGTPDSTETVEPGGNVVREFSTRLNGVFDVRAVYRGGRITGVTRGGKALPVVEDRAREVTWIGEPGPAGARPDGAKGDGPQSIGGIEYLVFRHAGVLYAEAIR